MFSKNLLKLIDIPNSLGHYGLDDTYVANAANILLEKKYDVQQYILNDIVVKEDRIYRSYSMDNFIHRNKNQDNMRENSMISYNKELQSFKEKI